MDELKWRIGIFRGYTWHSGLVPVAMGPMVQ